MLAVDRRLPWLGIFPLAVDLANTDIITAGRRLDLLTNEAELETWIDAERPRYAPASAAAGHLAELRTLRAAIRALLFARVRGEPLPSHPVETVNAAAARSAAVPVMSESGVVLHVELAADPFDRFAALIGRSAIDTCASASSLRICHAPSCGMFFVAGNVRQTWCSSACGNRARVARHAARSVSA